MPMVACVRRGGRGRRGARVHGEGVQGLLRGAPGCVGNRCMRGGWPPLRRACARRTWYVLSNLSYMKRVMMLVFPTDWSPRNTCAQHGVPEGRPRRWARRAAPSLWQRGAQRAAAAMPPRPHPGVPAHAHPPDRHQEAHQLVLGERSARHGCCGRCRIHAARPAIRRLPARCQGQATPKERMPRRYKLVGAAWRAVGPSGLAELPFADGCTNSFRWAGVHNCRLDV